MNGQPCQRCAAHYELAQSLDQQAIELRKQRNTYRAETDRLRGMVEGLRAFLDVPVTSTDPNAAYVVKNYQQLLLAHLDANPPEVVRDQSRIARTQPEQTRSTCFKRYNSRAVSCMGLCLDSHMCEKETP